jgi:hypothetical protein
VFCRQKIKIKNQKFVFAVLSQWLAVPSHMLRVNLNPSENLPSAKARSHFMVRIRRGWAALASVLDYVQVGCNFKMSQLKSYIRPGDAKMTDPYDPVFNYISGSK